MVKTFNRGTFRRGYNRMIECVCCHKKTQSQIGGGTDLCQVCLDSASFDNEHSDSGHDEVVACCAKCHNVSCMHEVK